MNAFSDVRPSRAVRKSATRGRVLAHARRLFAQRGYEATTIRDVARTAGVAVGTVFVHFPDKAALLAATLDAQLEGSLARAYETLPRGGAQRRIRHVLQALFRGYARHPVLSRVLLKETLFATGRQREWAQAGVERFIDTLRQWCSERHVLRHDLKPGDAAEAIFAAYLVALIEGLAQDRPRPDHMVARVERLVAPWFMKKDGGRP